jgi:hypothetical protein
MPSIYHLRPIEGVYKYLRASYFFSSLSGFSKASLKAINPFQDGGDDASNRYPSSPLITPSHKFITIIALCYKTFVFAL